MMVKRAHLTLNAFGIFTLRTTYDERLVTCIKELPAPYRRWDTVRKVWHINVYYHEYILAILKQLDYAILDEVRSGAVLRRPAGDSGFWLMAGTPGVKPMRVQCPLCQQMRQSACFCFYEDALHTQRLQCYNRACGHAWELCFQVREGCLYAWTEALHVPVRFTEHAEAAATPDDLDDPPPPLRAVLDAARQERERFPFEAWLKYAMGTEEPEED